MATSKQKHTELKNLSKTAKRSIYDMLKLTDEILTDHDYVDEFGGEDVLLESLEADEFAHFGGSPRLSELLRAYRHNPGKATWEEHRYNVWAMIELAAPVREAEEVVRTNWKAMAKELEAERDRLRGELDETKQQMQELRERVAELSEQNAEFRGQVRAMEKYAAA